MWFTHLIGSRLRLLSYKGRGRKHHGEENTGLQQDQPFQFNSPSKGMLPIRRGMRISAVLQWDFLHYSIPVSTNLQLRELPSRKFRLHLGLRCRWSLHCLSLPSNTSPGFCVCFCQYVHGTLFILHYFITSSPLWSGGSILVLLHLTTCRFEYIFAFNSF